MTGGPFTIWLIESDVMAGLGQPILSLVSRVFLNEHERIIGQLSRTRHVALLHYVLQQVGGTGTEKGAGVDTRDGTS